MMRIDDLNRAPQAQEAAKADAVRSDDTKSNPSASRDADSDAVEISGLATALAPSDALIEALRLQVERGEYEVSASAVARGIIDEHTTK